MQELLDFILLKIISLTESKLGYIYYFDKSAQKYVLSCLPMKGTNEQNDSGQTILSQQECAEFWNKAIKTPQTIIHNDFNSGHSLKKVRPDNIHEISRFIGVPIIQPDSIAVVVGVANKPKPYDASDEKLIKQLMEGVWKFVDSRKPDDLLKQSEEKYREIFENIQDTFYITDFEGTVIDISPSIEEISGYTSEELIGKSILEIYSVNDSRKSLLEELVINGYTIDYEVTIVCKNGEHIRCSVSSKMIFNEEGDPVRIVASMRKIEERKRAEEALARMNEELEARVKLRTEELARSEELYFTTVNSINDLIFVIDRNNNIVFVNEALLQFFKQNGFDNALIGKNVREKLVFLNEEAFENFENVFSEGKEFIRESEFAIFDKTYFTHIKISPVFLDGKVTRIVIAVHDLTDIKRVEKDIRKNLEREKELNTLKSRFISTVSHEFRTPLAGILSSVQLLQRSGEKWPLDKKEKMYTQISDNVYHTKKMLEEVSLIDKEQSNRLYFKPSEVDVEYLLKNIIDETLQIYGDKYKIEFNCELEPGYHFLDAVMLRHIFNNLLSNAIKYCGGNSVIQFNVTENDKKEITFIIEDHGIGIPEEDVKNVFEPFHRATNVDGIQGTGFGMSVVKKLVDFHKGNISLKSELGKGTKVTVMLPGKVTSEQEK